MEDSQMLSKPFAELMLNPMQFEGINNPSNEGEKPQWSKLQSNLIPRYIQTWGDEQIDAEVIHRDFARSLTVPLQKVVYTSGEHTEHVLTDTETGSRTTYPAGTYAVSNMDTYKGHMLHYVNHNDLVHAALDSPLTRVLYPMLPLDPDPVSLDICLYSSSS